jgi:hypothetical protein
MQYDILVLCPCTEAGRPQWTESIAVKDVDEALSVCKPTFTIPLSEVDPADYPTFSVDRFRDFQPAKIAELLPAPPPPTPPKISPTAHTADSDSQLGNLLAMVDLPESDGGKSRPAGDRPSGEREALAPLEELFADPNFSSVERTWQALRRLHYGTCSAEDVRLHILPAHQEHLDEALEVLAHEMERLLPSLLVADVSFSATPRDFSLMGRLIDTAAAASTPLVFGISSEFFGITEWEELETLSYLPHLLEEARYSPWRKMSASPSAELVFPVANEYLIRHPHGREDVTSSYLHEAPPWTNPVWAALEVIAKSIAETKMPTHFLGMPSALEDLHPLIHGGQKAAATRGIPSLNKINQAAEAGINFLAPLVDSDKALFPRGVAASGRPFAYSLFVCHIARVLILARDTYSGSADAKAVHMHVEAVFKAFWSDYGEYPKDWSLTVSDVDVSDVDVTEEGQGKGIKARVTFTPEHRMCPVTEPVHLELLFR